MLSSCAEYKSPRTILGKNLLRRHLWKAETRILMTQEMGNIDLATARREENVGAGRVPV